MIDTFHFLRPLFLLLLPVVAGLWWWTRAQQQLSNMQAKFAPHLAEALTIGQDEKSRLRPTDTLCLILLLSILALSGPSWRQLPAPWFSEEAPLVIALEVSDSMRSNDVLPTRLDRARIKILELLKERTGARTALIAYSQSAHLVVPLTKDAEVIRLFLESLDPLMMPSSSTASSNALADALGIAESLFPPDTQSGSLVVVTDSIRPTDAATLEDYQNRPNSPPSLLYIAGTEAGGVALLPNGAVARDTSGAVIDTKVRFDQIENIARPLDIPVVRLTSDVSDIRQLVRAIKSRAAAAEDPDSLWIDESWWLLWPIAILVLIHFRQGWTSS